MEIAVIRCTFFFFTRNILWRKLTAQELRHSGLKMICKMGWEKLRWWTQRERASLLEQALNSKTGTSGSEQSQNYIPLPASLHASRKLVLLCQKVCDFYWCLEKKKKKKKVHIPRPPYNTHSAILNHTSVSDTDALEDSILISFIPHIIRTRWIAGF